MPKKQILIRMSSKRYGTEEFLYDTEAAALEGLIRLYKSAQSYFKKDQEPRTISVTID